MANKTLNDWYQYFISSYAIEKSYNEFGERFSMTDQTYITQRTCAKCGAPASEATKLYPSKDRKKKYCRNCLPFTATIIDGKKKLTFTDRAAWDAHFRKEAWEQAYYEVCTEERRRLDVLLFHFIDTLPLYVAERKFCRLCDGRVALHSDEDNGTNWGKYVRHGPRFRIQVTIKMKAMLEDWKKHWYYKTTWRWNPAKERIPMNESPTDYKWEDFFPLLNDPAIHAANVEIGARIEVYSYRDDTQIKGRIVFRIPYYHCMKTTFPCNEKNRTRPEIICIKDCNFCKTDSVNERMVDCTHVAIADIPLDQVPETTELDSKGREWAKTTENRAVKLDPEEHYMALRSYVQGIAEVGLEAMFASRYPDDPLSLPFGFNTLMQRQVLFCLKELCPNAAKSILYKAVGYVLESAPDEWILARKSLLDSTYGFTAILKEHDLWEMADKETQKRIVTLLGKLQPPSHITGGNTQNVIYVPGANTLRPGQPVIRDGLGQVIPFLNGELEGGFVRNAIDIPVTALHNGERPLDFAAIPVRVIFPAGSRVNMRLGGDQEVHEGDLLEFTDEWLTVWKMPFREIQQDFHPDTPDPPIIIPPIAHSTGRPGDMIQVIFNRITQYTYPAVEQLREQRQDAAFRREMEMAWHPEPNGFIRYRGNGRPVGVQTIADAAQIPENILRGITAGTYREWERDNEQVIRYLLQVSAAVGMPVARFQNFIPQLLQLNDVQMAADYVRTYYSRPTGTNTFRETIRQEIEDE